MVNIVERWKASG